MQATPVKTFSDHFGDKTLFWLTDEPISYDDDSEGVFTTEYIVASAIDLRPYINTVETLLWASNAQGDIFGYSIDGTPDIFDIAQAMKNAGFEIVI